MNKKSFILFFILILLFINANVISAIPCEYDDLGLVVTFDENGNSSLEQTIYDEKTFQVPVIDWFWAESSGKIEIINELKHQEQELYGSCPAKIYACTYEKWTVLDVGLNIVWDEEAGLLYSENKKIYLFYSEDNMKRISRLDDLKNRERHTYTELAENFEDAYDDGKETCGGICGWGWGLLGGVIYNVGDILGIDSSDGGGVDLIFSEYKNCNYVEYTGDAPTYNLACPNLNVYLKRFNNAINQYTNCSNNNDNYCAAKAIEDVNKQEDAIKKYCRSILENYNYDGANEQECLDACIDIGLQTIKAKKFAGLISDDQGECGFSARLLVWISNILRWIKYILPVLVIILAIIDFIKAISDEKDDEMKKAQKRFIIRLIAAALVFIIPLILEFVLNKMGFGYNSCGLF